MARKRKVYCIRCEEDKLGQGFVMHLGKDDFALCGFGLGGENDAIATTHRLAQIGASFVNLAKHCRGMKQMAELESAEEMVPTAGIEPA